MSKFQWWRRERKRSPLSKKDAFKGRSFLLQQIEHGDYDYSDYRRQALNELDRCKREQKQVTANWVASAESLQEKLHEVERKYIKRYNRLMEDHHEEEHRLLSTLKEKLFKEFGVDCWDEALKKDFNQDLIKFYHNYAKIAKTKLQEHELSRSQEAPAGKLHQVGG